MRRSIATLLLVLAAPLSAQASHPNFSGKWTLDAARSVNGPEAATLSVSQTDRSLNFEQSLTVGGGSESAKLSWLLDGSPSKNSIDAGGGKIEVTSTTAWEDLVLVVKSTADVQGTAVGNIQRWSMDASGTVLTLETVISAGARSMSSKQVFKKI